MLRPTLVTPATPLTLVTLDEAKAWLNVDFTDQDSVITSMIKAAESHIDAYSGINGRAFLNQTWSQVYGCFDTRMDLPVGIASSITAFTYYDATNTQQDLSVNVFQLLNDALGSYVKLKAGQSWPSSYSRDDAITITWVAGYGAAASSVPEAVKVAMKHMVAAWFADREGMDKIPESALSLLAPFRRVGI